VIGAQPMRKIWRLKPHYEVDIIRMVRSNPGASESRKQEKKNNKARKTNRPSSRKL
jgi:hypothetical protein